MRVDVEPLCDRPLCDYHHVRGYKTGSGGLSTRVGIVGIMSEGADRESMGDGGEDPVAGGRVVASRESARGLEYGPLFHLGGGGGADVAIEVNGEGKESEVRMPGNLITIFVDLPAFAASDDVSAVLGGCRYDCTVDRETGSIFRVILNPNVGRPPVVRVEDLTAGVDGGPACGDGAVADRISEEVVSALCVSGGLDAGECMLAEGVQECPRSVPRWDRTSKRN